MKILLAVALLALLAVDAQAETCRSTRGPAPGNGAFWSWRLIDGKRCWYIGKPNKPKNQLHWSAPRRVARPITRRPKQQEAAAVPLLAPLKPEEMPPAPASDALLATTCCWPEIAIEKPPPPPLPLPKPPQLRPMSGQLVAWLVTLTIIIVVGATMILPTLTRRFSHERTYRW